MIPGQRTYKHSGPARIILRSWLSGGNDLPGGKRNQRDFRSGADQLQCRGKERGGFPKAVLPGAEPEQPHQPFPCEIEEDAESPAEDEKPDRMAPTGQTVRHFPQRMHSGPLMSFVTSTAMGQDRSHFLQSTHLPLSRCIWKKLNRLNRE